MEHGKQLACECLKGIGLQVSVIPESNQKRADLCASDGIAQYLVEVKDRLDDPAVEESLHQQITNGEVAYTSVPYSYSNRIDGILRDGRKQLDATPKHANTFNLLWVHATGLDSDLKTERARNTFYGLVPQIPLERQDKTIFCFYFDFATSFRMPTIHGLVLLDDNGLQLCINEFSDDVERFRESSLVRSLSDAVVDPPVLESQGEAIVLRSDISRRDETAVLAEVERIASKRICPLRIRRDVASVAVCYDKTRSAKRGHHG